MTTFRIPLSKIAIAKLALSLQELAQDDKGGYVTIDDVVTEEGIIHLILMKAVENEEVFDPPPNTD